MRLFPDQLDLFPDEIDPFLIRIIDHMAILDANEISPRKYNNTLREAIEYANEACRLGSAKSHFHLTYLKHYEFRPETSGADGRPNQLAFYTP